MKLAPKIVSLFSGLKSRLCRWYADRGNATKAAIILIGGVIAFCVSRSALLSTYQWLIVDSPVHYREIEHPNQEITRKGVYLARDEEHRVTFYLWGIDPEQADDWKVGAEMNTPANLESLYQMARAASWHGYGNVVLLPGKGPGGGNKALLVDSETIDLDVLEARQESGDGPHWP